MRTGDRNLAFSGVLLFVGLVLMGASVALHIIAWTCPPISRGGGAAPQAFDGDALAEGLLLLLPLALNLWVLSFIVLRTSPFPSGRLMRRGRSTELVLVLLTCLLGTSLWRLWNKFQMCLAFMRTSGSRAITDAPAFGELNTALFKSSLMCALVGLVLYHLWWAKEEQPVGPDNRRVRAAAA